MSAQTFPVIYGENRYMVDPNKLFTASRKFAQLVQPFGESANQAQLVILVNNFSERCIHNFLNLVQNLPADVLDSEMKEICEVAKMFQADQIYNTGLDFIQKTIDPSFYIPENKYENGKQSMMIEIPDQIQNIAEIEFDSNDEELQTPQDEHKETEQSQKKKISTVIYEIKIDRPKFKCNRYHFILDGQVLLSAKKKGSEVVIGKGPDVHISDSMNHCGKIVQEPMYNSILADDQNMRLKYIRFSDSDTISMSVSFLNKDKMLEWDPKPPKRNVHTGSYGLKLGGAYHHKAIASNKNSVLINSQGKATFITRKMGENFFEAECNPEVSQTIVFAIALSSIIGPSIDKGTTFNDLK